MPGSLGRNGELLSRNNPQAPFRTVSGTKVSLWFQKSSEMGDARHRTFVLSALLLSLNDGRDPQATDDNFPAPHTPESTILHPAPFDVFNKKHADGFVFAAGPVTALRRVLGIGTRFH